MIPVLLAVGIVVAIGFTIMSMHATARTLATIHAVMAAWCAACAVGILFFTSLFPIGALAAAFFNAVCAIAYGMKS